MRAAIIYHSSHHGNTRKVLDALAAEFGVELLEAAEASNIDLGSYDAVSFASGIYYSEFAQAVTACAERLPAGMPAFLIYTCGSKSSRYGSAIRGVLAERANPLLGTFGCRGWDTFGLFRLIGGIAKHHPDDADLAAARAFYANKVLGAGE